jgi:hypothetical protein
MRTPFSISGLCPFIIIIFYFFCVCAGAPKVCYCACALVYHPPPHTTYPSIMYPRKERKKERNLNPSFCSCSSTTSGQYDLKKKLEANGISEG